MCDYSLHLVANWPAKKLVTTKFNNSITRGFAAVGQPNVAVCLLPGTEVAFDENVECEPPFGIGILSWTGRPRSQASAVRHGSGMLPTSGFRCSSVGSSHAGPDRSWAALPSSQISSARTP